jgi:hypothetical protein
VSKPMSALGQKRTCAVQNGMSALPPKADIRSALNNAGIDSLYAVSKIISLAKIKLDHSQIQKGRFP